MASNGTDAPPSRELELYQRRGNQIRQGRGHALRRPGKAAIRK